MKYDVVGLYEHNEISYDKVKEAFKTSDVVGIVQATGTGKVIMLYRFVMIIRTKK